MADELANKLRTSQEYLDQLKQLSEDPKYGSNVPDDTKKTLQDAISRAENLYKAKSTQNEWLEVAQTLGQAATQFGAAAAGSKSGRDMSNLQFAKGPDYQGRTDRAFREYQQDLRNAGELATTNREATMDRLRSNNAEYSKKKDFLGEGLREARSKEEGDTRQAREDDREKLRIDLENKREADAIRRMGVSDLDKQERSLSDKLKAAQNVSNIYSQLGDADKRSTDKLNMALGPEAAKADIPLSDLKQQLETAKKPGIINRATGGLIPTETEDTDKQKGILDSKVQDIRTRLYEIRNRKQELLGGSAPSTPSTGGAENKEVPPPPAGPSSEKIIDAAKLTAYAKKYGMSEDKARQYLESQGYTYAGH